jgi:hypothetical protein
MTGVSAIVFVTGSTATIGHQELIASGNYRAESSH